MRLNLRPVIFVGGLLFLLSFQNCSQPQDDSGDLASYQSVLPFAYQATIDTLAYMSCSNITSTSFEPRAYFSFRAGAYSNTTGGLQMTPAFYSATQYYLNSDRANALSQSEYNQNTVLNLSIRSISNYQSIYATDSVTQGNEIDVFLPELDLQQVGGPFASLALGQQANYFPGQTPALMEASLRFLTYENVAADTRNDLTSGTAILVAGYPETANATDQSLKSPLDVTLPDAPTPPVSASNTNEVFGVGYKIGFSVPYGNSNGDPRVISTTAGIQEVNLTSNQTQSSSWDCDPNFEFQVVRPEDLAVTPGLCLIGVDTYANATQQAALNAIRRVLRVEDWYVNVAQHCVVPTYGGDICYGSSLNGATIQYSLTACTDNPNASPPTVCPHMVSVCIRQ